MKRVAILQSCYIPWKGYFDIIGSVDEFVLYDEVQYTKQDWRNRNRIKTPRGLRWLTIPVKSKGRFAQKISDTIIDSPDWAKRHLDTIIHYYASAPHFQPMIDDLRALYETVREKQYLSEVNRHFLVSIAAWLGLTTVITDSKDYELIGDRNERLVNICLQAGATEYLCGTAAKTYLDVARFNDAGITVRWMDYRGYREYSQLYSPPFVHEVSILDLLLNVGREHAGEYLLSSRTVKSESTTAVSTR
ncbi:WbqC family protein [Candidatus Latescibacterota bacterium]